MRKVFLSPGKFVIGKDELYHLGEHIRQFGSNALLLAHKDDSDRVQNILDETCAKYQVKIVNGAFEGECTYKEVERIKEMHKKQNYDCIIGLGGGKAIDTAKCLADQCNLPMLSVPTIVSTDAPCSSMAVIYDENHRYVENYYTKRSPAVVLIDSQIIANAPERFLVAGIGDAYATYFEAEACMRVNATNYGQGKSTLAAFELAKLCYKTLLENAEMALIACREHVVTPALENVIEANTLLSGIGFESVGLAAAHCFSTILFELGAIKAMHGELVAFGVLIQFILENRSPEQIKATLDFYRKVGLPLCLKDIGIDINDIPDEKWNIASQIACSPTSTMRNMSININTDTIKAVILYADKLADVY